MFRTYVGTPPEVKAHQITSLDNLKTVDEGLYEVTIGTQEIEFTSNEDVAIRDYLILEQTEVRHEVGDKMQLESNYYHATQAQFKEVGFVLK